MKDCDLIEKKPLENNEMTSCGRTVRSSEQRGVLVHKRLPATMNPFSSPGSSRLLFRQKLNMRTAVVVVSVVPYFQVDFILWSTNESNSNLTGSTDPLTRYTTERKQKTARG